MGPALATTHGSALSILQMEREPLEVQSRLRLQSWAAPMISLRTPQHRTSMLEFLGKDLAAPRCTGSDGRHVAGGRRRERVGREAGATGMRRRQIAIGMLNDVQCPAQVGWRSSSHGNEGPALLASLPIPYPVQIGRAHV